MLDRAKPETTYSLTLRAGEFHLDGYANNPCHRAVVVRHPGPLCIRCHGSGHQALNPSAEALVLAIAAMLGVSVFNVNQLMLLSSRVNLLKSAIGGRSAWQLGKALHSLIGIEREGYVLTKAGRDRAGAIWALRRVR